ncbi:transposase [Sporomusa acidovorans]|uniref:Probable transposase IS891/IS1136/IS1341 domain-containing protein n=1 Tax=Sporomusa acidovorans (strain ATCC 49682 / DSM 3132 / Mol) TaxID=1123286 RepID=A0ABZ3J948_SPOA4|nr:transposase [Sporomusa acidovorans]OZC16668.1 putative transposase [Sporomusa acidovorans DSM 3132]SDE06826.1 Transposase [Sporomusa acidovorans]
MQITVQAKILPTKEQFQLINSTTKEYIRLINQIVSDYITAEKDLKYTSKNVNAELPSAVKNQAIQDAKSVFHKYQKTKKQSILKKPVAIWNNQNYCIKDQLLSFPVLIDDKSKRIEVPIILTDYPKRLLTNKLGSLRISQKSGKYIAQIAIQVPESESTGNQAMGIDLGLKIPAVAVTQDGKTKFFGNGRQNKFIKRKHRSARRKLGKLKKLKAIKKRHDKEQRWMKDQDHKISRQIVDFLRKKIMFQPFALNNFLVYARRQEQAVKTRKTSITGHSIV